MLCCFWCLFPAQRTARVLATLKLLLMFSIRFEHHNKSSQPKTNHIHFTSLPPQRNKSPQNPKQKQYNCPILFLPRFLKTVPKPNTSSVCASTPAPGSVSPYPRRVPKGFRHIQRLGWPSQGHPTGRERPSVFFSFLRSSEKKEHMEHIDFCVGFFSSLFLCQQICRGLVCKVCSFVGGLGRRNHRFFF